MVRGELVACPQFPTTLPTLDELIGMDAITEANVAEHLLQLTREPRDHVYTLHAELEGMKLAPVFEKLLEGWKAQGYDLLSVGGLADRLNPATFPLHSVVEEAVRGRSGKLAVQGLPFIL